MIVDYLKNKYAFSKLKKGKWKKKPSTYAHYRFGQEVLKELPNDIKKIIIENKELCDIGLHGPDLFFDYLPLKTNEINSIGYNMHEKQEKKYLILLEKWWLLKNKSIIT